MGSVISILLVIGGLGLVGTRVTKNEAVDVSHIITIKAHGTCRVW